MIILWKIMREDQNYAIAFIVMVRRHFFKFDEAPNEERTMKFTKTQYYYTNNTILKINAGRRSKRNILIK
jgi:hypothetical protein